MGQDSLPYEPKEIPSERCPFCGSVEVITGTLGRNDSLAHFTPDGLKWFTWSFTHPDIALRDAAAVCKDCGALWSWTDVTRLREVLARWEKSKGQ